MATISVRAHQLRFSNLPTEIKAMILTFAITEAEYLLWSPFMRSPPVKADDETDKLESEERKQVLDLKAVSKEWFHLVESVLYQNFTFEFTCPADRLAIERWAGHEPKHPSHCIKAVELYVGYMSTSKVLLIGDVRHYLGVGDSLKLIASQLTGLEKVTFWPSIVNDSSSQVMNGHLAVIGLFRLIALFSYVEEIILRLWTEEDENKYGRKCRRWIENKLWHPSAEDDDLEDECWEMQF